MTSIIKQFDAHGLNYTFVSSRPMDGTKHEDAFKSSTFYSYVDAPCYWQITFSQPITAESYQFCPNSPYGGFVKNWSVKISNGSSLTTLQTDSVSSRPSGAVKFSFSKPISFRSFRITSKTTSNNGGEWLRVGQFDLFGQIGAKNRATIDYGQRKQRKIRNIIILMMMQLTTC